MILKGIGYWEEKRSSEQLRILQEEKIKLPDFIHPAELREFKWDSEEKQKIVDYLRNGYILLEQLGHSYCRFDDGPPDHEMGNKTFTDGVYCWPEGLAIYLEKYSLKLPDFFITHARTHGYSMNESIDMESLRGSYEIDFRDWISWCESNRALHRECWVKKIFTWILRG